MSKVVSVCGFFGMPPQFIMNVKEAMHSNHSSSKYRIANHARVRAWQRYRKKLNREDLSRIGRLILMGKCEIIKEKGFTMLCYVEYCNTKYKVIYDRNMGIPRTFLKYGMNHL